MNQKVFNAVPEINTPCNDKNSRKKIIFKRFILICAFYCLFYFYYYFLYYDAFFDLARNKMQDKVMKTKKILFFIKGLLGIFSFETFPVCG